MVTQTGIKNKNSTCTAATVIYNLWHNRQWHQVGLWWWTIENSKRYRWQLEVRSHYEFQHVIARSPASRYWRIAINTTLETVGIVMAMQLPGKMVTKTLQLCNATFPHHPNLEAKLKNKWTIKITEMQDAISLSCYLRFDCFW